MAIHGTMPAKQPNQKESQSALPGVSYFSMSSPKKIMLALAAMMASNAAISEMPQIIAISTIMMVELTEYSIQRP